jgi:3-hydroxyisobutyrate dehydrogenase-like beta-hydroxyacid dehydrogenase
MTIVNDAGIEAPLCRGNAQVWQTANQAGYGAQDMTYVAKLARDQAGLR